MKTSRINWIVRRALLAAPATCALVQHACGGRLDELGDASLPNDASIANDGSKTVGFDAPAMSNDTGTPDTACTPHVEIDGACPGPYAKGIFAPSCGAMCPTACDSFFKMCNCSTISGYSMCSMLDAGAILCACQGTPGGRWTDGITPRALREPCSGAFFAWMVWGESASIHAFEVLARELAAHGAPERLVAAAERAKRDEQRHTRMGLAMAARFGVKAELARPPPRAPVRTLEAIAMENAIEACVSETWSAVLTRAQAERAANRAVRRMFARIAAEEASHAALAWSVAEWAEGKLSVEIGLSIRERAARAIDDLRCGATDPSPELRMLGLPTRDEQLAMLDVLDRMLWRPWIRPVEVS